jgi:hypothetical protein
MLSSGTDLSELLQKSDKEIIAATGYERKDIEELRNIKVQKIDSLISNVTDWKSLRENNNTGLADSDLLYAEKEQKKKIDEYVSKHGSVRNNLEWIYNSAKLSDENTINGVPRDLIINEIAKRMVKVNGADTKFTDVITNLAGGQFKNIQQLISNNLSNKIEPINVSDNIGRNFEVMKSTSLATQPSQNVVNDNRVQHFVATKKDIIVDALKTSANLEHTNNKGNKVMQG